MVAKIEKGGLIVRNRYYKNSKLITNYKSASLNRHDRFNPDHQGYQASVKKVRIHSKFGKSLVVNKLKMNLGSQNRLNQDEKNNVAEQRKHADKIFMQILKDKRKLYKTKQKHKEKQVKRFQKQKEEKEKRQLMLQQKLKMEKQERAERKIKNIQDKGQERRNIIRSSLSYKYLKNTIPVYKLLEKKHNASLLEEKKKAKPEKLTFDEIKRHSKIFNRRQMQKNLQR